MANTLYPLWKKLQLDGAAKVDFDSDTIKLQLTKVTGTGAVAYNATHDMLDDVSSGAVGTAQTLTNKTTTGGKFSSDPVTWTAITSVGNTLGVILYKDTGTPSTSPIIAYYDVGTNTPATPNGGDITATANPTNGWFSL